MKTKIIKMKESFFRFPITYLLILLCSICSGTLLCPTALASQLGATFSKESIGVLIDHETKFKALDIAVDFQAQKANALIYSGNLSTVVNGLSPFVSLNKDKFGNVLNTGLVVNVKYKSLDIAGGFSVRGVNPVEPEITGKLVNGEWVRDESENSYTLPDINNVNFVVRTGFEKYNVETDLTIYEPITERDEVPTTIISRSQTSIDLSDNLSLSIVVDGRFYLTSGSLEWAVQPLGSVVFRW